MGFDIEFGSLITDSQYFVSQQVVHCSPPALFAQPAQNIKNSTDLNKDQEFHKISRIPRIVLNKEFFYPIFYTKNEMPQLEGTQLGK